MECSGHRAPALPGYGHCYLDLHYPGPNHEQPRHYRIAGSYARRRCRRLLYNSAGCGLLLCRQRAKHAHFYTAHPEIPADERFHGAAHGCVSTDASQRHPVHCPPFHIPLPLYGHWDHSFRGRHCGLLLNA